MNFIRKKTDRVFILKIYVKPNSYSQEIKQDEGFLLISLKSKPEKNKANKELIKFLKKKLNLSSTGITFIYGLKNPYKIIQVNFNSDISKEEIIDILLRDYN